MERKFNTITDKKMIGILLPLLCTYSRLKGAGLTDEENNITYITARLIQNDSGALCNRKKVKLQTGEGKL